MGTPQQFSLKWNNYSQHIVTAFEDLRGEDDLTDVTLSCEGKRIKAHKVLLSACSVYFKETFRENPCKHPVVILKGVSFADLQAVVTFMYNGQVNISQERLNSFLQTAELLQIKGLTDMNDQEESSSKKRPHPSSASSDPVITNVTHGKGSSDDSSIITPEIVTPSRPPTPTPKRKRIGPASFMQQQQNLSQQNDSQVPSSNSTGGSSSLGITTVVGASSSTLSTSAAGPSSVSSSTGGLLNPETVILPSTNMMDPSGGSNSGESFSHGIIKFEEEEVIDEDDEYEKNNLSEDNDNSMHDMLGNVEQEQNSLGTYIAGTSGQQPIKILTGGQDTAVHVKHGERWKAGTRPVKKEEEAKEIPTGPKPPKLRPKVFTPTKTGPNRFLKTEPRKVTATVVTKSSAVDTEHKHVETKVPLSPANPIKSEKPPKSHQPHHEPASNGTTSEGDVKTEKVSKDVEPPVSPEDFQAEQIRIRFQQEEFMSQLDLLRNPPPNVPISLPSLRPIPKLQRGSQQTSHNASSCSNSTTSMKNFSSVGLSHSLNFSAPNFSISQQLLKSAKATARAKEQARALSVSGGLCRSNSFKLISSSGSGGGSGGGGKSNFMHHHHSPSSGVNKPIAFAMKSSKHAVMDELNFSGLGPLSDSGGPFVCDLCGKRYVHHRSLNDHKKFHTGATTCQYCNKAFSKVANLRAHVLAQHKDSGHDGYSHMQ